MRLIVQADDFAMTDGIGEGILKCGREGILTQTGLMTNAKNADYYARRLETECPHVSLGQDINLVSGKPLSDPAKIPTLVDKNGVFLTSRYHRKLDREGHKNHIAYEDAYTEIEAQVQRFFAITGHRPAYSAGHAYDCENTIKARRDVFDKYGLGHFEEFFLKQTVEPWSFSYNTPEISIYDAQLLGEDPIEMFRNGKCGFITDHVHEKDKICFLHTHAGYVDYDLIKMSSLTLGRAREVDFLCDPYLKQWIADNDVVLVGARELKDVFDW